MNDKGGAVGIDENGMPKRRVADSWHVGKEIPLVVVGAVLLQTAGLVWSIAGLYNRVDNLVTVTNDLKQERYTKEDARRDRDMLMQSQEFQRQRDAEQDRRINQIEVVTSQLLRPIK